MRKNTYFTFFHGENLRYLCGIYVTVGMSHCCKYVTHDRSCFVLIGYAPPKQRMRCVKNYWFFSWWKKASDSITIASKRKTYIGQRFIDWMFKQCQDWSKHCGKSHDIWPKSA